MAAPQTNDRSPLDRFLGIFADVHSGEGVTALLLALNVFLILMAYYILKPVREALILGEGSAELKSYMSAGQVVVLAFVVPLYGRLVASRPRMRLINTVTTFFMWASGREGGPESCAIVIPVNPGCSGCATGSCSRAAALIISLIRTMSRPSSGESLSPNCVASAMA